MVTEAVPGTTRRGRPSADVSQRKIATLLDVAREMFSDLGYRAVTMRKVAEQADVSTRTLYNHYPDKLSLFIACLDFGAQAFPEPIPRPGEEPAALLRRYAAALVTTLSTDSSLRLGMLIYREGAEFPELLEVGNANRVRYVNEPLATYLRSIGLERPGEDINTTMFLALVMADWQRRVSYRWPLPNPDEIERHVARAVTIFLEGVAATMP